MKVENAAGRIVNTEILGRSFNPFRGAKKHSYSSKVIELSNALKKCKIKSGDTISFHHQLRNGDYVVNMTLDAIKNLGIKNIRMAQTAIFNVHEPVIDFIKDGVVNKIEGSINGVVGDFVSKNPLDFPVILRSHGGRWAAVKTGDLHPNIAVIAASAADERGNCTGIIGESAFGPISYSQVDAMYADYVIIVGYSIPESDSLARAYIRESYHANKNGKWIIIDPNRSIIERFTNLIHSKPRKIKHYPLTLKEFNNSVIEDPYKYQFDILLSYFRRAKRIWRACYHDRRFIQVSRIYRDFYHLG